MNLGLALPAGLLALAGLLLPLLLHLARRTEQRPTVFAALRWLEAGPRPRRRLRLDERLLLATRLLLLAALALLLAQPVLHGAPVGGQPWVVVVPGIAQDTARAALAVPDAEWRWLAPGFPALDREPPPGTPPVSSLLREIDATLPADTPLTALVPARLDGLDGERPVLRRNVDWRALETPAAAPSTPRTARIVMAVRHAPGDDAALRYLRAVAAAWSADGGTHAAGGVRTDIAVAQEPIAEGTDWLTWLAPGELPPDVVAWIEAGGIALVDATTQCPGAATGAALWRDARGDVLVLGRALGRGRVMQLTRGLSPAGLPQLLEPTFPGQWRALFDPPSAPSRAFAATHAPLTGGPELPPPPRPLHHWLAWLVAALFVVERWLATSRRRERPA